jgi:hypothetical protein
MTMCNINACFWYCTILGLLISIKVPPDYYYIKQTKKSNLRDPKIPMVFYIRYESILARLCGLVVRVPGFRSRSPDAIPGATRFSEK